MNNTLENGLKLLLYLASSTDEFSVSGLAVDLNLPKSHVHRLLQSLQACGYVERTLKRRYRISIGALRLGRSILMNTPIRTVSLPLLVKFSRQEKCNVTLAMPYGYDAMSVASVNSDGSVRNSKSALGSILLAHASASGKLFLAYKNADEQKKALEEIEYPIITKNTHKNAKSLHKNLLEICKLGYSINNFENGTDSMSLAIPLRDEKDEVFACIGATISKEPTKKERLAFISRLKEMITEIEEKYKEITH